VYVQTDVALRGHEQVQHGCLYVSGDRKPAHYTK